MKSSTWREVEAVKPVLISNVGNLSNKRIKFCQMNEKFYLARS